MRMIRRIDFPKAFPADILPHLKKNILLPKISVVSLYKFIVKKESKKTRPHEATVSAKEKLSCDELPVTL